jgi:hypothetical protein
MSVRNKLLLATATLLAATASPIWAHHSFSAEFDSTKTATMDGTVARFDWSNPHSFLYLDVQDKKGTVVRWKFELGGPLTLTRMHWTRDSLKPGDRIKVYGFLAKDGSPFANGRIITFKDGHTLTSRNGHEQ